MLCAGSGISLFSLCLWVKAVHVLCHCHCRIRLVKLVSVLMKTVQMPVVSPSLIGYTHTAPSLPVPLLPSWLFPFLLAAYLPPSLFPLPPSLFPLPPSPPDPSLNSTRHCMYDCMHDTIFAAGNVECSCGSVAIGPIPPSGPSLPSLPSLPPSLPLSLPSLPPSLPPLI